MRKLLPIILISMLLAACGKLPEQHIEGTAFGTIYHITYLGDRSEALPKQVDSVLKEINNTFISRKVHCDCVFTQGGKTQKHE